MKSHFTIIRLLGVSVLCILITGCLLKPATVTTRRFVLTPAPPGDRDTAATPITVGIGRVRMPDYLLKDSMAVRKGGNEIQYLENVLWAEGLDHSFQRTLAANLSSQLGGSRVRLSSWQPGEVALAVRVSVERLDVDAQGRGTLIVQWTIEAPESGKVLKDGESSFSKSGPVPHDDPASIAATLSDLTAQFSEAMAKAVRECAPTGATR